MKNLMIMVGPPGSGKTTYSQNLTGYLRISQDDDGKFGHLDLFINCLRHGESMIVDRMNMTKAQRNTYLRKAKEYGFSTEIVVIEEPFQTCLYRCFARKDHPSLTNEQEIRGALMGFYQSYERPEQGEADKITFLKVDDKALEIRNKMTKIEKFESLVNQGYLRKSEKGNLVLYGYTDKCTFDRNWTKETKEARGIILDTTTNKVVARPFPKFFNLGEMEEVSFTNLPKEKYTVHEKVDGSLGILFYYDGEWQVATRGSFHSDQAKKGAEILKKYDMRHVPKNVTLLAEIIYPENKIIVDYGNEEKLVLLGAFNPETAVEITGQYLEAYSRVSGIPLAKTYNHTIEEMIELQKVLPKDNEGFVVRFDSGLRVKIKGEEYLRIAKIISHMSPISFWESIENGKVKVEYLQQLPEELRDQYEPIVKELEDQYNKVQAQIIMDVGNLPLTESDNIQDKEVKKKVGLFLKNDIIKHKVILFPYLYGQMNLVDNYIKKIIRPDGNQIRNLE